jgi:small neutral amino acid transporter SnatA (MarC family)
MVLFAPAAGILCMITLMEMGINKDLVGFGLGLPAFLFSFWSSFYCGNWLARRVSRKGLPEILITVILGLLLQVVNYAIAVEGCIFFPRHL